MSLDTPPAAGAPLVPLGATSPTSKCYLSKPILYSRIHGKQWAEWLSLYALLVSCCNTHEIIDNC